MPREPRTGFKVVYDSERKYIFAIGGHDIKSGRVWYPYVQYYDISKDSWTELSDCSFANMKKDCCFIRNKILYVISMPTYGKYVHEMHFLDTSKNETTDW
jgi:hypothetical protein